MLLPRGSELRLQPIPFRRQPAEGIFHRGQLFARGHQRLTDLCQLRAGGLRCLRALGEPTTEIFHLGLQCRDLCVGAGVLLVLALDLRLVDAALGFEIGDAKLRRFERGAQLGVGDAQLLGRHSGLLEAGLRLFRLLLRCLCLRLQTGPDSLHVALEGIDLGQGLAQLRLREL